MIARFQIRKARAASIFVTAMSIASTGHVRRLSAKRMTSSRMPLLRSMQWMMRGDNLTPIH